jgi:hypothetical protein
MDKRQLSALIKELEVERDNLDKTIEFLTSRFQPGHYRELTATALAVPQPDGKKRGRPRKAELKANTVTKSSTKISTKYSTKRSKRNISDEARKKMSDAAKRRHANKRKQSANA